ncbi:ADP-ribosylation factor-like protein 16 [Sycon ciliatum]|uniref:ADP-ribosylation factor-like protein 16 n=1 Tax=Sycon ciliatum TaxID=27933 RepID=UPI0020A990CC
MIMLMGPRGAGKTTLLKKLAGEDGSRSAARQQGCRHLFDSVLPPVKHTTGISLGGYTCSNTATRITVREIGSSVYPLWSNFVDDTEPEKIVFIIDGSNRSQISTTACQFHSVLASDKLKNRPFALVINKWDAALYMKNEELKEALHLDYIASYVNRKNLSLFKLSIKDETGLEELRRWVESPLQQ